MTNNLKGIAMTTIHYAITTPTSQHRPDNEDGRLNCAQTIEKAIATAIQVCSSVHETTNRDFIATADRYLVDLHLTRECQGCEPISFGWTVDFEPPHDWVMRGFCKTSTARDPLRAHLLVAHVVEAWRRQGLVDWIEDEAEYLPEMNLGSLIEETDNIQPPQHVEMWLTSLRKALNRVESIG